MWLFLIIFKCLQCFNTLYVATSFYVFTLNLFFSFLGALMLYKIDDIFLSKQLFFSSSYPMPFTYSSFLFLLLGKTIIFDILYIFSSDWFYQHYVIHSYLHFLKWSVVGFISRNPGPVNESLYKLYINVFLTIYKKN